MRLTIHPHIFSLIPEFKLGMIHYTKTTVSASPKMLKGRLQLFQEQLYFDLLDKEPSDFPGLAEWQKTWKKIGADPSVDPLSLEMQLQQIKEGKYFSSYHSAEDLNTFFSLQYEIPMNMYDMEQLTGDIELSIGTVEEGYEGLNNQFNTFAGQLLLSDGYSPFGSPRADSLRTAVTEESINILQLLFIRPSFDRDNAVQLTEACAKMFTSINGGDYTISVLDEQHPAAVINSEVTE